jgi:hypothetical protein
MTSLPMASYAFALFGTCYAALEGISYDYDGYAAGYAARVCGPRGRTV